jgi:Predicted transcriptional regulators
MIGKKLKAYRINLELTGETLANLAGIQRSYLSQIENEKKVPPFDTFINLVKAIAKVSLITEENEDFIFSEKNYELFRGVIRFEMKDKFLNVFPNQTSKYELLGLGMLSEEPDHLEIEETLREAFNSLREDALEWEEKDVFNLLAVENYSETNDEGHSILPIYSGIYEFDFIRNSLYEWWYNHILQDIMKTGIKDNVIYADETINEIDTPLSAYNTNISEGDRKLLAELWPLMNENGDFTPTNDDNNTNITKELLNGKVVNFDLNSYTDKNIRLFLDGQLLSNQEKEMLKVSLSAIRFNRK